MFGVFGRICGCGEPLRAISDIDALDTIKAILDAEGLPSTPLPVAPARPPPVSIEEDAVWAA